MYNKSICEDCKKQDICPDVSTDTEKITLARFFIDACDEYEQKEEETETWNGFHGQLEVPKGTFDKIWNDEEGEAE